MDEVVYIIIIFSLAVVLGIILIFVKKIEKYKTLMLKMKDYCICFNDIRISERKV